MNSSSRSSSRSPSALPSKQSSRSASRRSESDAIMASILPLAFRRVHGLCLEAVFPPVKRSRQANESGSYSLVSLPQRMFHHDHGEEVRRRNRQGLPGRQDIKGGSSLGPRSSIHEDARSPGTGTVDVQLLNIYGGGASRELHRSVLFPC